nr:rifin PIR protein, putative [Plasmodium sp. DRC-Itaito]
MTTIMNLQYSKILLFFLQLSILVTSYQEHNKNKPYITPHHTQTNRSLCECDIQSSIYKDSDMKSVKERFDDRTSQRFQEYEERMKDKRQKRKEERDKNIQKIIEKDKMDKSLSEKVEIGCFRCGCALGGVAASVGVFGGLGIYGWKSAATATAIEGVKQASIEAGEAARIPAVIEAVIEGIKREFGVLTLGDKTLQSLYTTNAYPNASKIAHAISIEYNTQSCLLSGPTADKSICTWVLEKSEAARKIRGKVFSTYDSIEVAVKSIVSNAEPVAETAAKTASDEIIQKSIAVVDAKSAYLYSAIGYSVLAILIIVLVMIIIYLVLRYRRKKKMNKRDQYTKLLNQ